MKNKYLITFLAIAMGGSCSWSQAQTVAEWPEEVIHYFQQTIPNAIDNVEAQAFDALFMCINDIPFFSFSQGIHSFNATSKRAIWNNHDHANTWTVVDQMAFKYGLNLMGPHGSLGNAEPGVSLTFGAEGLLHYLNIRRSDTKHYPQIDPIAVRENETENLLATPETPKWYDLDPLHRAQFYQMGKRLEIPLRIPFTHKSVHRLDVGEIISYDVSGTLSLSGNVGWTIPGFSDPALNLGASVTTYLRKGFRYTVQRMAENTAKIKVTDSNATGRIGKYGISLNPFVIFDGVTVLGSKLGEQTLAITPFQFEASNELEHLFDVAYEYDLTQEIGQKAYDSAMLGNLKPSGEEAEEADGSPHPPVKVAFTQQAEQTKIKKGGGVTLGFIYHKQDSKNITRMDSEITLPDGAHHLFRSISDNTNQWTTFIGQDEKIRYQFSFFANMERYEKNLDDSLSLLAEGFMDDAVSSGPEMRKYSNRFEALAGVTKEVFPRLPLYPPPVKLTGCAGPKGLTSLSCIIRKIRPDSIPAHYGRSSFYVKLGFNRPMLEKFMNTDKEEMWPILQTAFNVENESWSDGDSRTDYFFKFLGNRLLNLPGFFLNHHYDHGPDFDIAKRFHHHWAEIADEPDIKEKITLLSKMFSTVHYGEALIKALRLTLKDTKIPYSLSAENKLFSRQIRDEDWGITVNDYLSIMSQREIDIENVHSTVSLDETAKVSDLKIKVLDVTQQSDTPTPKIKLAATFKLSAKPKFLYFKIMSKNRWSFTRNISEAMLANVDRFQIGMNSFQITNETKQELGADLFKSVIPGKKYRLVISISRDGKIWGPITDQEFTI